jgi:single-strand DNA-binding protein
VVDFLEKHVEKGAKVLVEGSLKNRKWKDQAGNERQVTEVEIGFNGNLTIMSSPNGDGANRARQGERSGKSSSPGSGNPSTGSPGKSADPDDEIPF